MTLRLAATWLAHLRASNGMVMCALYTSEYHEESRLARSPHNRGMLIGDSHASPVLGASSVLVTVCVDTHTKLGAHHPQVVKVIVSERIADPPFGV